MNSEQTRRFRFAPILTATVLTVLLLWLFKTVAQVLMLLMIGILISLYLGAVADWIQRRTRLPERLCLTMAILGSLGALVLLAFVLVPPVVDQTRQLIQDLPRFIASWESGIDSIADRMPGLRDLVGSKGEHRTLIAAYDQLSGLFGSIPTRVFEIVHVAINIFAVGVMAIYLSVHPALYREWLIALFPPIHRDLVRDVLSELADSLRAYIVGQLLAMSFLGALTAVGLWLLDVPLLSTTLPALFVLTGQGYHAFSPLGHAMLVVGLGVVIHLIEGNIVSPLVMSRKVDLPPVLTIMSVLIIGQLLGGLGLIVALPTLVTIMVIVRRILISRIYEGQGFRRTTRERPLVLRVPAPGGGVIAPPGAQFDVVTDAERSGRSRSAA